MRQSVYWTPAMYFQWANGSFSLVPNEDLQAYYYTAGQEKEILPYPEGFRMIAGSPILRSNQNTPAQKYGAVNFGSVYFSAPWRTKPLARCMGTSKPDTPYLPRYKCPSGIRADIYLSVAQCSHVALS
jgi:hypothetical protein